jgi:AraC-like DNA-binding protein
MTVDRLDALLQRFSLRARLFHSGPLCGRHDFAAGDGLGQLHLVRRGPVRAGHGGGRLQLIEQPSVLFYPRPLRHRLVTDPIRGADMACAEVAFASGLHPLVQALPAVVVLPLAQLDNAQGALELLFEEAFGRRCGRQQVVDRLFEVVLVMILRALIAGGQVGSGVLAGLGDPGLARALVAIHEAPGRSWSLADLAARAALSRSRFAARFLKVVGCTPGDYLARYRMAVAQDLIRRGQPLAQVADAVGYGSAAAFSRAFSALCGCAPGAWRAGAPAASTAQPGSGAQSTCITA